MSSLDYGPLKSADKLKATVWIKIKLLVWRSWSGCEKKPSTETHHCEHPRNGHSRKKWVLEAEGQSGSSSNKDQTSRAKVGRKSAYWAIKKNEEPFILFYWSLRFPIRRYVTVVPAVGNSVGEIVLYSAPQDAVVMSAVPVPSPQPHPHLDVGGSFEF